MSVPPPSDQSGGGPIERAVRRYGFEVGIAHWQPWRTGRKVGRTIYVQVGEFPSDDDPLIGVMDTPVLADEAVRAHNIILRKQDRP